MTEVNAGFDFSDGSQKLKPQFLKIKELIINAGIGRKKSGYVSIQITFHINANLKKTKGLLSQRVLNK